MLTFCRRPARALAVLVLGLALAGCGSEAAPVDDGSYSSLQAGAPAALESAGVELLAATLPPGVDLAAVQDAVADTDLPPATRGGRDDPAGLAFDPSTVSGLLGTIGNQAGARDASQHYVVLVFDEPASAVVWAETSPEVFAATRPQRLETGYLAGSLVGYYAPAKGVDSTAVFTGVLRDLAGVTVDGTEPTP